VFVTAHAAYAVEAFAVEAFDYLLKPVESGRLARVVERLAEREPSTVRGPAPPVRIPVVAGGQTELVESEQVNYAQAEGDYSRTRRCGSSINRSRRRMAVFGSLIGWWRRFICIRGRCGRIGHHRVGGMKMPTCTTRATAETHALLRASHAFVPRILHRFLTPP